MSTETNLTTLRDTLSRMTRASVVGGFGPDFVKEIMQLDRAIAEVTALRRAKTDLTRDVESLISNGLATVKVLEAYARPGRDRDTDEAIKVYRASFESYRPKR